jgi:hypothetical protein
MADVETLGKRMADDLLRYGRNNSTNYGLGSAWIPTSMARRDIFEAAKSLWRRR